MNCALNRKVQHDPEQPERLIRDLRAVYDSPVSVPQHIDDAVLNHARESLAPRHSRRLILRIGALVTAAAAMLVIVIHLKQAPTAPAPVAVQSQPQVDIVDALKLARRIRADASNIARDDINHDGAVNQKDVDAIAMAAVRLPEARVQ